MRRVLMILGLFLSHAALADDALTAKYACVKATKQSLHDPGSAVFDDWRSGYAKQSEKSRLWRVQIPFRAKNGYGAYRNGVSECTVAVDKQGNARALSANQIR
jgi:hypothetical protein